MLIWKEGSSVCGELLAESRQGVGWSNERWVLLQAVEVPNKLSKLFLTDEALRAHAVSITLGMDTSKLPPIGSRLDEPTYRAAARA